MDIGTLLRVSRGRLPRTRRDAPALSIGSGPTLSYGELDGRSNQIAHAVRGLGARRGDRVAILMHNSLDYVAAYFAVTSIGCIAVRVNFRLSGEELVHVLSDSGSTVLLLDDSMVPQVEPILDRVPVAASVVFGASGDRPRPGWARPGTIVDEADESPPDLPIPDATDPACLLYTSGTTGRPKGAMWSHGNSTWVAAMQVIEWSYTPGTVAMTTGPLYHVGGLEDLVLPCLLAGGHAVITPSGNFDLLTTLDSIRRHSVTDAFLFPFMLDDLAELPDSQTGGLTGLTRIVTGGSALTPRAARELARKLPDTMVALGYGLTEGGAVVAMPESGVTPSSAATAGRPLPGVEIRIRSERGEDMAEGADGEVWVRGPAVARSYWNNPDATAATFVDNWCRTGDIGRVADGALVLTGRAKDMIRSGGENVYPAEIEAVLMDHPDILDVAVIGVPEPRYQEAVCAVVVPRSGRAPQPDDLIRYTEGRLARYKQPKHVILVDELPRNPSGKVEKYVLREQYASLGAVHDSRSHEGGRR